MQMPHEMVDMVEFEATWSRLERVVDLLQDETRICLDEASNGSPQLANHASVTTETTCRRSEKFD